MTSRPARHRFLERRVVRDAKIPYSADDPDVENNWRRWHEVDGCG